MIIDKPIAIAVILFIILLLIFFMVMPQYQAFGNLQTELAEKQAEYNAQFAYYNEISATYQELQANKDNIAKIDDALPQDPALGKLVYYMQDAVAQNGIIMKSLFVSQPAAASNKGGTGAVKNITLSMSLTGSYNSLEQFIVTLEKSSRIFEVTNISFGSPSAAGAPSGSAQSQFQTNQTYSFSVQAKTHSY